MLSVNAVADLRFGEGGVLGKGLCVPKARSARGAPGHVPPGNVGNIGAFSCILGHLLTILGILKGTFLHTRLYFTGTTALHFAGGWWGHTLQED